MYDMHWICLFWKKRILFVPLFNLVITRLIHDFDANVLVVLYYGKKGRQGTRLT